MKSRVSSPSVSSSIFLRFTAGEEGAFNHIFHSFYPFLCYYGQSLTGEEETAKEIVSAAFLKLWEARYSFTTPGHIKYFLIRVVRNASIDYHRTKKRWTAEEEAEESFLVQEKNALSAMIEAETFRQLHAALKLLPPRCREVFQAFYFRSKSLKEIAAEMNVSVNTVKTQKARALQFLKTKLTPLSLILILNVHLL